MKFPTLLIFAFFTLIANAQYKNTKTSKEEITFTNLFSSDLKSGVSCYRIPALGTAPNGDLIAAIDERVPSCGDLKWSNDINIVIRRSTDNGKSWSNMETIVDYPVGQSASDASMIVDEITNEIFLFFNYMNLETEKDVYYLKMISSKDNGHSWSTPIDLTSQITKPEWQKDFKFITSGRGIQTKSGALIHNIVNLEKGLFLFKSDDHGKTWNLIETEIKPADESKLVELADGILMVNSRVNNLGYRYIHTSKDGGLSWTSLPDKQLIDPGCNASIIRYNKNILLFSNLNSEKNRENLTVKYSTDEGKTWSKGKTIYAGSAGYSSMTVLKDGSIGLFFEKDDYTSNVFTKFYLKWLTDGGVKSKSIRKK